MFGKPPSWKLFAALVVGTMALFFNGYEPWQPIGPDLMQDGSFSTPAATNAWNGWTEWARLVPDGGFQGSQGVVLTTTASNRHGILRFTVNDLTDIPAFRVSLRATAQGVVRGKKNYFLPRAIFFYRDTRAKNLFSLPHRIMNIPDDTGWRHYKDFFPVPEGTTEAQLYIQNLGVAGILRIDDVSVIPVRNRPSAPWFKLFFGTLWTAAFGVCLFALRPWARRYGWMIMATLCLIMIGIVLPGKLLDDTIEKTVQTSKNLRPQPITSTPQPPVQIAKSSPTQPVAPQPAKPKKEAVVGLIETGVEQAHLIGHLILFSLLAFFSALSWFPARPSLKRAGAVFTGLVFFAAATEVLQFIPTDRSAGLSELSVDLIGMAGAVILVFSLRGIQAHRTQTDFTERNAASGSTPGTS